MALLWPGRQWALAAAEPLVRILGKSHAQGILALNHGILLFLLERFQRILRVDTPHQDIAYFRLVLGVGGVRIQGMHHQLAWSLVLVGRQDFVLLRRLHHFWLSMVGERLLKDLMRCEGWRGCHRSHYLPILASTVRRDNCCA